VIGLPNPYLLLGGAAAALALAGAVGVQTYRLANLRADLATQAASFSEVRALASLAHAREEGLARTEETRRRTEQQEKINAAETKLARARTDRANADAAAVLVQQRFAAALAANAGKGARDPEVVGQSAPADGASGVLADVFGRCLARVQLLARTADERGVAGELCVEEYDALTPTK